MSYFAVNREAGPAWIDGQGAFEQPGVNDHAAFMSALVDEGLVLFAGPLAGSEQGRIRVLLIGDAASEDEIGRRLAADPWERAKRLMTVSIEPWGLIVGAARLGSAHGWAEDLSLTPPPLAFDQRLVFRVTCVGRDILRRVSCPVPRQPDSLDVTKALRGTTGRDGSDWCCARGHRWWCSAGGGGRRPRG